MIFYSLKKVPHYMEWENEVKKNKKEFYEELEKIKRELEDKDRILK